MPTILKKTVLILEDYDILRDALGKICIKKNYRLCSSGTLQNALLLAQEEQPQLIVFDANMSMVTDPVVAVSALHSIIAESTILVLNKISPKNDDTFISKGAAKVIHPSQIIETFGSCFDEVV